MLAGNWRVLTLVDGGRAASADGLAADDGLEVGEPG